jgi:histidinol phosphatase-like enzyme (inositol monophosphatase family)
MAVSYEDEIGAIADLAIALTKRSRPIIHQWFRQSPDISRKSDQTPVTTADHAVEAALRAEIASRYPDHGIIGEEGGATPSDHDFTWVIDPIDGTRAFSTGNPLFGTLIAVLYRKSPVIGIIDIPAQHQTWLGVEGRPTTLNGEAAAVSGQTDLSQARLSTTSGHDLGGDYERFQRLSEKTMVTGYGGDCANYAYLSAGWTDLVAESTLNPHDIMATVPVIKGAGGMITQWDGAPITLDDYDGTALASASAKLHDEASRLLAA